MKKRSAVQQRITNETKISMVLNVDVAGKNAVDTTIPFLDHMLNLFAHHAGFSFVVKASGDTQIDDHHLVEDIGITLGQCLKRLQRSDL